ncbi:MAG: ubiquitin-activating E1 FCCH domain-containing protein [Shewanella sp.]
MAAGLNVKFQGSKVEIQTGLAATKAITAVTRANPAVVTSTAHGFVNGDFIFIAAVVGMTELNGGWYSVQASTANTFELANTDSTGYGVYTSGGTAQAPTYATWCEIKSVSSEESEAADIDVSTICSPAKEYEVGLQDAGTLSFDYNYVPKTAIMARLRALRGVVAPYKITFPGTQGVWSALSILKSQSFTGGVDGVWEGSATLRVTGVANVI